MSEMYEKKEITSGSELLEYLDDKTLETHDIKVIDKDYAELKIKTNDTIYLDNIRKVYKSERTYDIYCEHSKITIWRGSDIIQVSLR